MNVICFGDSNTYGYDPRSYLGSRYPVESRWTALLAEKTGWTVRNEGMNGREIPRQKQMFPKNTDLLIIMLGTNDLLQGHSAEMAAARMHDFIKMLDPAPMEILLIAPPSLQYGEWVQDPELIRTSKQLSAYYRTIAGDLGILYADASLWDVPLCFDGVHFTENGNRVFAEEIANFLFNISDNYQLLFGKK